MNVDEVFKSIAPASKKAKLDEVVNEEEEEIVEMDESGAKRLLNQLDKRIRKNQEMRTKFFDQPLKFLDSEMELYHNLNSFMIITNNPEYFEILMDNKMIPILLALILHDNIDISLSVIKFILRLTDPDELSALNDAGERCVLELLDGKLISHCVDVLAKLDETDAEEADGVFSILNVVENITDISPKSKSDIADQRFLGWLLKRIQARTFDENKLYVSEILAILLLDCKENQEKLGELDGIDTLLRQLSIYKKNDPQSLNEFEMMENMFDALCYALFVKSNQERFLKGEGLQLMILMLKERKLSRNSAIKVLDFSMNGAIGDESAQANCNKFVDVLGLRVIFSYFMRTPDPKSIKSTIQTGFKITKAMAKGGLTKMELEEYIINIMTNLIMHTSGNQKSRILSKFTENNFEKVQRLVELHMFYLNKLNKTDIELNKKRQNKDLWKGIATEDVEKELSYIRLSEGQLIIQNIDIIIAEVCVNGDSVIVKRVLELFVLYKLSTKVVIRIIEDYKNSMEINRGDVTNTKEWLDSLLRKFVPLIPY